MALRSGSRHAVPLFRLLAGVADAVALPVYGLQLDSRRVRAGDAFLALPGEQHDGRNYIADAVAAGAVAIVAEKGVTLRQRVDAGKVPLVEVAGLGQQLGVIAARFYQHPSERLTTVGITGTNGKTTTSRVLAQLLRARGGPCGVIGTLGVALANETTEAVNTTPDAVNLQRQLAEWLDLGIESAVLEVSSHSLVLGRVAGMHFDTAIFTNLTHDHLDFHGDMESYAAAKAKLFAWEGLKHAVINRDDPWSEGMIAALAPGVELVDYGLQRQDTAVRASAIRYHDSGLEARVHTPWGEGLLHSPLAGDFNLANVMAAISAACLNGMALDHALSVIPHLDVAVDAEVANAVEAAAAARGRLDILHSHVGVQVEGTLEQASAEGMDASWRLNVRSHFVAARSAVPHMRRQGGGSIIVTSSNSGVMYDSEMIAYATSKHAAVAMVRQMAKDYARENIRFNALCPGWVDTPFNLPFERQMGGRDKLEAHIREQIPMGRWARPEEIADGILFLASDRSSFMTGQALVIDGGECLG